MHAWLTGYVWKAVVPANSVPSWVGTGGFRFLEADRTARSVIGYWHDNVVCLSVTLSDTSYTKHVWTGE